jgi:hypothetical protein
MQYQDITQQKLEQVKSPLLTAAAASFNDAAAKTRAAGIVPAATADVPPVTAREAPVQGKTKTVDVELF